MLLMTDKVHIVWVLKMVIDKTKIGRHQDTKVAAVHFGAK